MSWLKSEKRQSTQSGQAMVEFAIILPLMLFLTIGIIQLTLLFTAKSIVSYAAFSAARAAIVADKIYEQGGNYGSEEAAMIGEAQAAAVMVCSTIAGPTEMSGGSLGTPIDIPGWGELRGSAESAQKTTVTLLNDSDAISPEVTVRVEHEFELLFPEFFMAVVGVTSPVFDAYTDNGGRFIKITDSCTLVRRLLVTNP